MKKFLLLIAISGLISCHSREKDNKMEASEPKHDSTGVNIKKTAAITHETYNPSSKLFVWKTDFNFSKKRNALVDKRILNVDSLIKGLNELHENVYLEKVKISGDTIYTVIRNSTYLSESLGTSGAEMYLADVVLNLTELPGIKYVDINLEAGSHMEPGTWSDDDFSKYREKK